MGTTRRFDRRKELPHRVPDATRLSLLFVPLALQVALLRLLETTMLRRGAMAPVETLLWTSGPLPFLTVLFGIVAYRLGRSYGMPAVISSAVGTGTAALSAALGFNFAPWWISGWLTPTSVEVLRFDLLVIAALAALAVFVLAVAGPRLAHAARIIVHLVVPGIMTLSAAGFGYFVATGSPADWPILKYTVTNFGMLRELLADSVGGHHVVLLALPWLWSYGIWRYAPHLSGERESEARLRSSSVLALAPIMVVLALAPSSDVPPSVHSGSVFRIVRTAAADLADPDGAREPDLESDARPDFDTRNIALEPTDSTTTPNIVMVLMESVRSRSTTPYHPALQTMPFLDSLARAGMVVEHMFAVVSYTNKALVPIYAGIYPHPGREIIESSPGAIPGRGLPELLRPLGYTSAFFTSATMEFERKDLILNNLGFDTAIGAEHIETDGFYRKAYFGYEDHAALGPALDWAEQAGRNGIPFFLNFLTLTSHHPYDVPDEFEQRDFHPSDPELNAYYNALRYTDDFLRDLVYGIERLDLDRPTVFIIMGDHGEAFQEHLERTHGNATWDEALQVPAILYAPGLLPRGARISGPRQHVDLVPTVADLLNTKLTGGYLPGTSLLSPAREDRTLYHHSLDDGRSMALRRDSLKYLYFYRHTPTRVFNYVTDPEERRDLAGDYSEEERSIVELELLLWRKRVKAAYTALPGS